MYTKKLVCALLVLPVIGLQYSVADQPYSFQTIALTNQEVPGISGANYQTFIDAPYLNNSGKVLFSATISGPDVVYSNDRVEISGYQNDLNVIQREGDQAPGFAPGVLFLEASSVKVFDDNGDVSFFSKVDGAGIDPLRNDGAFFETLGTVELAMFEGDPAPDTEEGVEIAGVSALRTGSSGQRMLGVYLEGPGVIFNLNDIALYRADSTNIELLARTGDPAPGVPGFDLVNINSIDMNANGDIAFESYVTNMQYGIFTHIDGALESRVLTNTEAPGAGLGTVFFHINRKRFNELGQVAFTAWLETAAGEYSVGVFSESSGAQQLIARTGDQAAGFFPSQIYDSFAVVFTTNGVGEVLFEADLSGPLINDANNTALFIERDGEVQLLAWESIFIPNNNGEEKFSVFNQFANSTDGSAVFEAELSGSAVDLSNDLGIFIDTNGHLQQIVRKGDLFDVNDDPLVQDYRVITEIHSHFQHGLQIGARSSFNEASQLAFRLEFADGTEGIFVASPAVLGDLNNDGVVNLLDVAPFVNAITSGNDYLQTADVNCDGTVDLLDVAPFVSLLTG